MVFLKNLSARSKWLAGIGGVVVAASLVATILVLLHDSAAQTPPPVAEEAPDEALEYLASKEFAAQPADVRAKYMRQAKEAGVFLLAKSGDNSLTVEQRKQLDRNIRSTLRDRANETINKYFELPPEQRVAYLDKMIDGKKDSRRNRQKDGRSGKPDKGKTFTPETLKRPLEGTSAEERSRTLEFKRAWMQRMRERGMEPW